MTLLWWLWPLGGVAQAWPQIAPNVVASLAWATPGVIAHLHTRRRLRELHRKHDALCARMIRGERE